MVRGCIRHELVKLLARVLANNDEQRRACSERRVRIVRKGGQARAKNEWASFAQFPGTVRTRHEAVGVNPVVEDGDTVGHDEVPWRKELASLNLEERGMGYAPIRLAYWFCPRLHELLGATSFLKTPTRCHSRVICLELV